MKPCFGKLVVPNVTADHQWTGQRVKVITPQGHDLYIRSLQPLRLEVSSNLYAHGLYACEKFILPKNTSALNDSNALD